MGAAVGTPDRNIQCSAAANAVPGVQSLILKS